MMNLLPTTVVAMHMSMSLTLVVCFVFCLSFLSTSSDKAKRSHKVMLDSETVYMEDLDATYVCNVLHMCIYMFRHFSIELPDTDQSDDGCRDKALLKTYKNLVNIRYECDYDQLYLNLTVILFRTAGIHSWSDRIGDGQPQYSRTLEYLADVNEQCVTFH